MTKRLAVLLAATAGLSLAQQTGITGRITDPSGANIADGAVTATKIQINVDGQQVTQNSAGDGFGEPQYSQEAIDQFQIIMNRFDATQGRSSRLQVNVQTKSGTNQYHGTLYGYFRNDAFNASDSVAHRVLPFSDQQFGGTFGGPILRNKLFFLFAYEGERQPSTIFDTPTGFGGLTYRKPAVLPEGFRQLGTDPAVTLEGLRKEEDTVAAILRGGGTMLAGTDSPLDNIATALHLNLRAQVKYGLQPWQALQTATLLPAKAKDYMKF